MRKLILDSPAKRPLKPKCQAACPLHGSFCDKEVTIRYVGPDNSKERVGHVTHAAPTTCECEWNEDGDCIEKSQSSSPTSVVELPGKEHDG